MGHLDFDTFKGLVLERARKAGACSSEYRKASKSSNWDELLGVIKSNAAWCYVNGINAKFLSQVPDDILLANGIYVDKQGVEQREGMCLYYGNSTSRHYDNSRSQHYDNSTSEHYGNSRSEHYGNSASDHYDNSRSGHYGNSRSEHYGNSRSRHYDNSASEHYGNSRSVHDVNSTSRHYDNSVSVHYGNSRSEHYGNSRSKHHDNSASVHYSNSTSTHYDNSTSTHYDNNAYGSVDILKDTSVIYGSAIVRERHSGKVYCKKGAFEIVFLED